MTKSKNAEKKQNNEKVPEEERNNLLNFFSLLLEIDMRVNPKRYKLKKKDFIKLTNKDYL